MGERTAEDESYIALEYWELLASELGLENNESSSDRMAGT